MTYSRANNQNSFLICGLVVFGVRSLATRSSGCTACLGACGSAFESPLRALLEARSHCNCSCRLELLPPTLSCGAVVSLRPRHLHARISRNTGAIVVKQSALESWRCDAHVLPWWLRCQESSSSRISAFGGWPKPKMVNITCPLRATAPMITCQMCTAPRRFEQAVARRRTPSRT